MARVTATLLESCCGQEQSSNTISTLNGQGISWQTPAEVLQHVGLHVPSYLSLG